MQESKSDPPEFPLIPCRILVTMMPWPEPPHQPKIPDGLESEFASGKLFFMKDRSMAPNYALNEILAVMPLKDGSITYSPGDDLKVVVRKLYKELSPGTVVAVSINNAPMTCKRLTFRFSGMKKEILLTADSAKTPGFLHLVQDQDTINVYGTVARYSGSAK